MGVEETRTSAIHVVMFGRRRRRRRRGRGMRGGGGGRRREERVVESERGALVGAGLAPRQAPAARAIAARLGGRAVETRARVPVRLVLRMQLTRRLLIRRMVRFGHDGWRHSLRLTNAQTALAQSANCESIIE